MSRKRDRKSQEDHRRRDRVRHSSHITHDSSNVVVLLCCHFAGNDIETLNMLASVFTDGTVVVVRSIIDLIALADETRNA